MVLESTMVCVDSSDYMRNGDFIPSRLQSQQDAVNLVCHSKTRSNPENNVGLLTLANIEVLATLTSDVGRILSKLHQVQPDGQIKFTSGIRVAHLALKHRQGKNHRMRIVAFVGSPVEEDDKELVKLAKKLKKEKVNVDVINFGEEKENTDKLTTFINTINGKDGTSCHLVTVPPGPMLSDALISSPIIVGEDGAGAIPGGVQGFEFGIDPNEDPELALALRVSMEEQRSRQEEEARKVAQESAADAGTPMITEETSEEALLKQALEMSMGPTEETPVPAAETPASTTTETPAPPAKEGSDFGAMTEEEQIAYAMQLSLQPSASEEGATPMDTEETAPKEEAKKDDEDLNEVINDPEFLQSVLEGLPGVDPQSEDIRSALGQLSRQNKDDKKPDDKKEKK